MQALDELGETDLPRSNIRRSPRKTEKQAVYVLNLTVPPNQLDNCLEPTKTDIQFQRRDVVLNLLSTTVTGFLSKNGFLTPHHDQINPPFSSPRKKRKILNDSGFAAGSDYGKPSALEDDDITTHQSTYSRPFIYDLDQSLQQIAWTDPSIGETFIIDTRTGNSCPKDQDGTAASSTRRTIRFPATFVASRDAGHEQPPEWLQKALQSNNTYGIGENSVQKVLTRPPEEQQSDKPMRNQQSSFCDGSISETRQHRFRKEDLSHSVIVEQVDSKFIACLFPSEEGHVLVLVDQHAADERIRVEQFLEDICSGFLRSKNGKDGVHIRQLCPPLPILLTSQEARLLNESSEIQEAFRHWGFHFECSKQEQDIEDQQRDNSASNYAQVFVRGVPEVVSDKLLLGDELRDVVKGFLSQHDANFSMATSCIEDQPNDEVPWLKGLRWCPRGLLDLVNSKACRVCTWKAFNGAFDTFREAIVTEQTPFEMV
ncbi:hypothetical protein H0H93_006718 [Arthromyces matolae]|nr:hypothetical protein H0H93_006718 [Arthromyces matolae]